MMKYTHTIVLLLMMMLPMGSMAQSLEIVEEFKENKMSTVLTTYKNEFGHREKQHVMDNKFPFAVLEVYLEGDEQAVKAAKSKLSLDLGSHFTVEGVCKTYNNRIVFLISSSVRNVYMTCGDGCKEQVIFSGQTLEQNRIYYGRVKYTPAKMALISENQEPLKKQYFKFRIHPADVAGITVLVTENGQQEPWNVAEGIASKKMDYGVYHYVISADRYHKTEGSFTVSDTNNELDIQLRPQFGWLNVSGDNSAQGAYVFATNHSTGDVKQIGTIPLQNTELNAGAYSLRIQKTKYKDYLTTIQIEEGDTTTIRPVLEANFAQLTLAVQNGAEIWLDGNQLGTTSWTGTLELGEYTLEARQANHRSSYTQVVVSEQSVGKTIQLNNPKPIYGTFEVSGSPADATIYVDDKKAGTTPLLVNKILIGSHKVRIEKDGYDKQEKTVTITEGQEAVMDYTLMKEVAKVPILETPVARVTPQGKALETITVNGVSFNMVKVEGGTFTMGDYEEFPPHMVTLSDDYLIGETEVTQELWETVMGTNPSTHIGANLPVTNVSWNDCQKFIKKLNQLTDRHFRLPTEAEWEYAARGGNMSKGYMYAGSNTLNDVANDLSQTCPVKQKKPNELGLYDMSGNVYEWCQDYYNVYSSQPQINPQGPTNGSSRVIRGGSCHTNDLSHTISFRIGLGEDDYTFAYSHGVRLVMDSRQNEQNLKQSINKALFPSEITKVGDLYYRSVGNGYSVEVVAEPSDNYYRNTSNHISTDVIIPTVISYNGYEYIVVNIGKEAFWSYKKLKSISIPNSVGSIGHNAFYSCSDLKTIYIPNSVTSIGNNAFDGCGNLTSITIPNSVTSIGMGAFRDCFNLTSITIPNSVTSIGNKAFGNCRALRSITIPNSVTSIGNREFAGCYNLVYISVERDNPIYDSRDNCNAIIETKTNTLIAGCKNTVIPNSVTSIGMGAFEHCNKLTSIIIPNSVGSIGHDAFYGCNDLKTIYIPNSVTSIGESAFFGCHKLTSITIPNSVTSIGESAFGWNDKLKKIYIPRGTKAKFAAMEGLKKHVGKLVERNGIY